MWVQRNSISLRIVLNTVVVFLGALTILTITDYLIEGAITGSGSMAGLADYYIDFMAVNVLPILILFGGFLFFFTQPIQRVVNKISREEQPSEAEMHRAKRRMFQLPSFVLLLNFISFFGGTILFFSTQGYFTDLYSPRLWFQLVFTLSSAGVYAFLQSSMNRQVLTPARKLMAIHRIEKGKGYREMSLNRKTLLIAVLLGVYALSYFLPKLFFANEIEMSYSQELQSVVLEQKSLQEAEASFAKRFESFSNPPRFSLQERDITKQRDDIRKTFLLSFFCIVGILFTVGFVYSRELILQIRIQQRKMEGILSGTENLTERIAITAYDEVGTLSDLINQFMAALEDILQNISRSSKSIFGASRIVDESITSASEAMHEIVTTVEQISGSSEEQSRSVENARNRILAMQESIRHIGADMESQASFVEQTAGAMTQMAGNIASVSQNTQQANELGNKLTEAAKAGEEQLQKSITTIGTIQDATLRVSDIVKILANIAQQTNLLAMNAAIEAAHAGDAGRGFAVVASEIRKLAENSAIQSKEIIQHIDTMTSRVETGVAQTQQAGESFRSIIQDIRQTTQLVNQITAAMDEQRSGTDEILSSVGSVVDATNNVKQLTQDLNQQSQDIDHTMLDLVQISTHIREATTEQTRSNVEVSQMIGRLKDTSQGNVEVVSKLEQILQRFNLEGVSHDQTD